jgi:TolB-like protein
VLNQLAKIRSLTVISRSSVLRYASDRPPIPEIAQALNVGTVIEGSVRYAGNRILVTVQLIDAATDAHIWSESYPGDLSDLSTIFALQADIAMNVANALRAELTPAALASIEELPTDSPEAYEYYLARAGRAAGDRARARLG